jgi:hypothetical protein
MSLSDLWDERLALLDSSPLAGAFYVTCVMIFNTAFFNSKFLKAGDQQARAMIFVKTFSFLLLIFLMAGVTATAQRARWRAANETELKQVIPARAPVIKENIETEFRTASGVTDGHGQFIAGVVMITAGYSAEGKYSHFFITEVALKIGDMVLEPGEYVFGYRRVDNDAIRITFYRAATGEMVGAVDAHVNRKSAAVRSLLINPPVNGKATIQIGRYLFDYRING